MSPDVVSFIEHHGVKGQKWGVRRQENKAAASAHKEWKKGAMSGEMGKEVFVEALRTYTPAVRKLNKDPMWADINVNKATQRQYDAVSSTIFNQHMAQASIAKTGKTFGGKVGTRAVIWDLNRDTGIFRAREHVAVLHADMEDTDVPPSFGVTFDSEGFISDIHWLGNAQHTSIESFFEHHGVKGQKWGVRRAQIHQLSSDAKEAHSLRTRPTHSLSNKELKTINDRMNLEQNFRRMNPKKTTVGKKHATEILATIGIGVSVFNLATSPAGKAAISAGKKVLAKKVEG